MVGGVLDSEIYLAGSLDSDLCRAAARRDRQSGISSRLFYYPGHRCTVPEKPQKPLDMVRGWVLWAVHFLSLAVQSPGQCQLRTRSTYVSSQPRILFSIWILR